MILIHCKAECNHKLSSCGITAFHANSVFLFDNVFLVKLIIANEKFMSIGLFDVQNFYF